jgi:hypothetical protein
MSLDTCSLLSISVELALVLIHLSGPYVILQILPDTATLCRPEWQP